MFKVKSFNQNTPDRTAIFSGVTFGLIDIPVYFEVTPLDDSKKPLMIEFILVSNSTHKPYELIFDKIVNNKVTARFYIPDNKYSGILIAPANVANKGDLSLMWMFTLESFSNTNTYKMSYEFYYKKHSDNKEIGR
jgi:hypothetical protein